MIAPLSTARCFGWLKSSKAISVNMLVSYGPQRESKRLRWTWRRVIGQIELPEPGAAVYTSCALTRHRDRACPDPSEYHRLCRRLLSVGQQLEIHWTRRRTALRRRTAPEPDTDPALHPADPKARSRPDGRQRQSSVWCHGPDHVVAEAVVSVDSKDAALFCPQVGQFSECVRGPGRVMTTKLIDGGPQAGSSGFSCARRSA